MHQQWLKKKKIIHCCPPFTRYSNSQRNLHARQVDSVDSDVSTCSVLKFMRVQLVAIFSNLLNSVCEICEKLQIKAPLKRSGCILERSVQSPAHFGAPKLSLKTYFIYLFKRILWKFNVTAPPWNRVCLLHLHWPLQTQGGICLLSIILIFTGFTLKCCFVINTHIYVYVFFFFFNSTLVSYSKQISICTKTCMRRKAAFYIVLVKTCTFLCIFS